MTDRCVYLVLGMHRSGTSALTQLLGVAGARLPENPMPGDEHNPKGYYEPWPIAIFNDQRLQAADSAWDDVFAYPSRPLARRQERRWLVRAETLFEQEFGEAAVPVLKDPRITILLPFWRELLEDLGRQPLCAVLVRHPLAVAASLAKRDGFTVEKSLLLWTSYMMAAIVDTEGLARAFVSYDALLGDWRGQMQRLEMAHSRALPNLAGAREQIDLVLDPKLRRSEAAGQLKDYGWTGELAAVVYEELLKLCRDQPSNQSTLEWARGVLANRREDYGPLVSPAAAQLDRLRHEHRDLVARLELTRSELVAELAAVKAAWRRDVVAQERAHRTEMRNRESELKILYQACDEAERRLQQIFDGS